MGITSKDIIPLTRARAKFTELCEEIENEQSEKIITKNGEGRIAMIRADKLDYYHRLEKEHIHLTLLEEAVRGVEDLNSNKVLTLAKLRARYGR